MPIENYTVYSRSPGSNSPLDRELYEQIANEEANADTIKSYLSKINQFLDNPKSANHKDYLLLVQQQNNLHDFLLLAEEREKSKNQVEAKTWFKEATHFDPQKLEEDVTFLIEEKTLSKPEILSNLTLCAKKYGLRDYQVERFYEAKRFELEVEEELSGAKARIDNLLRLETHRLDISSVIPEKYGESIKKWCHNLDFRPEAALTSLIVGLSSCFDYRSSIHLLHQTEYYQIATLYAAMVAESGIGKSAVFRKFMINPLKPAQNCAEEEFQNTLIRIKQQIAEYKLMGKEEKQDCYPEGQPELPERAKRFFFSESTIETFAYQYKEYPGKSILYASDELNKLFASLDQYHGGKGSDLEKILELYDGSPLSIGRVGREGNIYVSQTGLSVFGGVQPAVLKNIWGNGNDDEGKSSRFLYVWQPLNNPQLDRDDELREVCELDRSLEFLYGLLLNNPIETFELSKKGRAKYVDFYNFCSSKNYHIDNRFIGHIYSKAKGQCGRLILNLHAINSIWQKQYTGLSKDIPDETVDKGIALMQFYINQAQLLHAELCPDDKLTPFLKDILSLAKKKKVVTAKDVKMHRRALRKTPPNEIRDLFLNLAKLGYGRTEGVGKTLKFTVDNPK